MKCDNCWNAAARHGDFLCEACRGMPPPIACIDCGKRARIGSNFCAECMKVNSLFSGDDDDNICSICGKLMKNTGHGTECPECMEIFPRGGERCSICGTLMKSGHGMICEKCMGISPNTSPCPMCRVQKPASQSLCEKCMKIDEMIPQVECLACGINMAQPDDELNVCIPCRQYNEEAFADPEPPPPPSPRRPTCEGCKGPLLADEVKVCGACEKDGVQPMTVDDELALFQVQLMEEADLAREASKREWERHKIVRYNDEECPQLKMAHLDVLFADLLTYPTLGADFFRPIRRLSAVCSSWRREVMEWCVARRVRLCASKGDRRYPKVGGLSGWDLFAGEASTKWGISVIYVDPFARPEVAHAATCPCLKCDRKNAAHSWMCQCIYCKKEPFVAHKLGDVHCKCRSCMYKYRPGV